MWGSDQATKVKSKAVTMTYLKNIGIWKFHQQGLSMVLLQLRDLHKCWQSIRFKPSQGPLLRPPQVVIPVDTLQHAQYFLSQKDFSINTTAALLKHRHREVTPLDSRLRQQWSSYNSQLRSKQTTSFPLPLGGLTAHQVPHVSPGHLIKLCMKKRADLETCQNLQLYVRQKLL